MFSWKLMFLALGAAIAGMFLFGFGRGWMVAGIQKELARQARRTADKQRRMQDANAAVGTGRDAVDRRLRDGLY